MYIPQAFEITDKKKILACVKANPFGQLVSTVEGRLFSTHLPFIVEKDSQSIICHIAKSNPQWHEIENQEVLVTFQGAHGYISPTWYESPGVPTWNYQAVHIYGQARLIREKEELKNIIEDTTKRFESVLEQPWQPEYKQPLLDLIVGMEISISELQCKFKLSQNRSQNDQINVIKALQQNGEKSLSFAMKKEL